jgi:3-oxoacyl-[acyl-carrier-protein] synthase III
MPDYGPAIEAVEAFVPRQSVAIEDTVSRLGISRNQVKVLQRVHGLAQLRWDPGLALLDMISIPAEAVLATVPGTSRVRYLVYAHTAPDVAPAGVNAAQLLRHRLGLAHAEAFAVTQQACASGLAAIDLAAQLLLADGDPAARALVVTGEKPATRFLSFIPGASVMGDGSAACLVNISGEGMRIRSFSSKTDGRYAQLMNPPPGVVAGFYATYASAVAEAVRETVARAGLRLADIEMIVPHNVNLSSWQRVISELGIPADRVYLDNVPRYGHCFSSDVLLNLVSMRAQGRLRHDGAYLLVAVGLGAVYAAMVIGG